ncbi:MAG TPA: hypothetical protein VFP35_00385 [Candidatus Saccharimonadales bacterium]|nr:hypothetical protein [Candidatus Saccharimonadales bacterium]
MYKHGKPIYSPARRPFFIGVMLVLIAALAGLYFGIIRTGDKNQISGSNKPLVSVIKSGPSSTTVDEPDFAFTLPGKWKLSAQNWDARYVSWQWQFTDKRYAGRFFEVYLDTIPTDYAYNYLLPVSADGNGVKVGQLSGNCANFTTTAQTKVNSAGTVAAVSKWQGVTFPCDYGRQSLQVVGTSSLDGINSLTLTGEAKGTHKYFFIYRDNDINPDLGVISDILGSFRAK